MTKIFLSEAPMFCKSCLCEKPMDAFYRGNASRCKNCVKQAVGQRRQERLEEVRAYDRLRGSLPHRVAARAEFQKTKAYAQSHAAAAKRWTAQHPERRRAHMAVNNAIRDGRLQKLPCMVCGEKAEAHHPDYDRPLDVVWLCSPHHKEAHALTE